MRRFIIVKVLVFVSGGYLLFTIENVSDVELVTDFPFILLSRSRQLYLLNSRKKDIDNMFNNSR